MSKHPLSWTVLAAACLLLAACQDRRDPVKPTTAVAVAGPATVQVAVRAAVRPAVQP